MKIRFFATAALAIALGAGGAKAATVTVNTDNTTVLTTTALTGFATTGADMAGMVITADFSNSASETLTWSTTGATSGGVDGTLFSLNQSGNTFGGNWGLVNKNEDALLTNLTIDAGAGDTVFDIIDSPAGTPGSELGLAFSEESAPLSGSITALYSNPVALTGEAPVGDLYALLMADFTDLTAGGLLFDSLFAFDADTDNLSIAGDLRPVPLPAALPLMLTALAILGFFTRRRQATA